MPFVQKVAKFLVMDTRKAKKLSLVLFLFILFIYFIIRYQQGDYFSAIISEKFLDVLLTAAELALSVWIALAVIEHSLKEDQSRHWKKVRKSTFSEIMHYVSYIAMSIPFFMLLELNKDDRKKVRRDQRDYSEQNEQL